MKEKLNTWIAKLKDNPMARQAFFFTTNWGTLITMPIWIIPYGVHTSLKNKDTAWMTGKSSIFSS